MNLIDILKQFKNIEPDAAYSATSKRAILATEPGAMPSMPRWSTRRIVFTIIETGAAVALTGFFIFLVVNGLNGTGLAPVQYAAINPQSLKAEAQAIDMQIEIANLNYTESAAESTAPIPSSPSGMAAKATAGLSNATTTATSSVSNASGSASGTTTSTSVTIDQALQSLGQ